METKEIINASEVNPTIIELDDFYMKLTNLIKFLSPLLLKVFTKFWLIMAPFHKLCPRPICLLLKKGKGPLLCRPYQPISLLNADVLSWQSFLFELEAQCSL